MILISIHPKYVKAIKQGIKKYELRKVSFDNLNTRSETYFTVYETRPISAITMIIKKKKMIREKVEDLWKKCGSKSATTKEFFMKYYKDQKEGVALEIEDILVLEEPITLSDLRETYSMAAPQNYYLLSEKKQGDLYRKLKESLEKLVNG